MVVNAASSDIVLKYFPELSDQQKNQFKLLGNLYADWNQKINVVSRKDVEEIYLRHVLHSLGIAKIISFNTGSTILDVGTGGGFPGIPLAILFPESSFVLIDSIGKKIKVVEEVVLGLGLKNVMTINGRVEEQDLKVDFVVARAVASLETFLRWVHGKLKAESHHELENGILSLKGGDLTNEISEAGVKVKQWNLTDYFTEEFFETKKLVYVSGSRL